MFIDIWTIQHQDAWAKALDQEYLVADGRRVPPTQRFAYRWMMWQMRDRLDEYLGRYPLWAWLEPKPDLRRSGLLRRGTPAVLVQLCVPEANLVYSDYRGWQSVLNFNYLALTREERANWNQAWSGSPEAAERLYRSWDRIFDLDAMLYSPLYGNPQPIQACLERFDLDDIEDYHLFTAR